MTKGEMAAILDLHEDEGELMPLTASRPLGTLPFAGRYRLVDFPLSAVAYADIHSVALFMPQSARSVQDHLRSGAPWNLDLIQGGVFMFPYVAARDYQDPAVRARYYEDYIEFLRRSESEYTVILGTQNVANIDLNAVLAYHKAGSSPITAVYKKVAPDRIDPSDWTLDLSGLGTAAAVTRAKNRRGQTPPMVPRFMGVYVIGTFALIQLLETASTQPEFKRLPELLRQAVLASNANAFEYTGYLATISSIQRYYAANLSMLDDDNYQSLLYSSIPIITKGKNEIPSFFAPGSAVQSALIGTGAYIEGSVHQSVISRSVVIHRDARVQNSILMQGAKISSNSVVDHAILDKGVVVGPNLTLKGTAEKPLVIGKNQTVYTAPQEVAAHG